MTSNSFMLIPELPESRHHLVHTALRAHQYHILSVPLESVLLKQSSAAQGLRRLLQDLLSNGRLKQGHGRSKSSIAHDQQRLRILYQNRATGPAGP